jgi:hypothetical protein
VLFRQQAPAGLWLVWPRAGMFAAAGGQMSAFNMKRRCVYDRRTHPQERLLGPAGELGNEASTSRLSEDRLGERVQSMHAWHGCPRRVALGGRLAAAGESDAGQRPQLAEVAHRGPTDVRFKGRSSNILRTAAIAVSVAFLLAASPAAVAQTVVESFGCETVGPETYVTVPGCGTALATAALQDLGQGLASCVGAGSPIVLDSKVPMRCQSVVPSGGPAFFALVINGTENNAANRLAATDAFRGLFARYTLSGANGVGSSATVVLGGRLLVSASDCAEAASVLHDVAASVAGGAYQ